MAPRIRRLRSRLIGWRQTVLAHVRGEGVMLGLAATIGVGTGLLAAALIATISTVQELAWGTDPGWLSVLLVPTLGAFGVGLLIHFFVPEASGSGIVQTMRTIALHGGRFRARVPFGGLLASGLAIGTGAAGGREGPIVLIGGSLGSVLGRLFAADEDRLKTLVAAGAAAGIGASFNAPIGGMLFALELIIGGFSARSIQSIVVASVAGSVTARQVIGPEIIYRPVATYQVNDPRELGLYAALGLAAVVLGLAFLYGEDLSKRLFASLRIWPPFKLALGGLALGLLATAVPEVLGTGAQLPPIDGLRDPIQAMLNGQVGVGYAAAGTLLLLAGAKLVATCLSIGSGNAIGTFAPVIFTGAALGGAIGHVAGELLTSTPVEPGAFALVGMAAAFGAAARAPLTAIVIVFEITGDYELVLPLMLATGLATFLADRLAPESIYTYPLRKKGIVYAEPEDVDIMQTVTVGEIMTRRPDVVDAALTLDELRSEFRRTRHHGFPVVEGGNRLVGIVTLADLARLHERDDAVSTNGGRQPRTVADICTRRPATAVPADPMFRALRRMAALDIGRMPVVSPHDHSRLVGLLRRSDLLKAYQAALTRSAAEQHRREASRLRDLAGVRFVELGVERGTAADGCAVRDIDWPARTILTNVQRHGDIIVPKGETTLRAGDRLTVLTAVDSVEDVRELVARPDAEVF